MTFKGILLGSAAALVAMSGARAADAVAVVAEPEPMEYVRVCDTYGEGYFYIPGTETCLRVAACYRSRSKDRSSEMGEHPEPNFWM